MNQYMGEVFTCLDVFRDCLFALFEGESDGLQPR